MRALQLLGLLSNSPSAQFARGAARWTELLGALLGLPSSEDAHVREAVYERLDRSERHLKALDELGLFDEKPVETKETPLRTLAHFLNQRLSYGLFFIY